MADNAPSDSASTSSPRRDVKRSTSDVSSDLLPAAGGRTTSQQRTFVFSSDFQPETSSRRRSYQATSPLMNTSLSAHAFDPPADGYDYSDRVSAPDYAKPYYDALASPVQGEPSSGSGPSGKMTPLPGIRRRNEKHTPSFSSFLPESSSPSSFSLVEAVEQSPREEEHSVLLTPPVTPDLVDVLPETSRRRRERPSATRSLTSNTTQPMHKPLLHHTSASLPASDIASSRPTFSRSSSYPVGAPAVGRGRARTREPYVPPPRGTFMSPCASLVRDGSASEKSGSGNSARGTIDVGSAVDDEEDEEPLGIAELDLFGADLMTRTTNWHTTLPWRKSLHAPTRRISQPKVVARERAADNNQPILAHPSPGSPSQPTAEANVEAATKGETLDP